jgi:hypothetical protein
LRTTGEKGQKKGKGKRKGKIDNRIGAKKRSDGVWIDSALVRQGEGAFRVPVRVLQQGGKRQQEEGTGTAHCASGSQRFSISIAMCR